MPAGEARTSDRAPWWLAWARRRTWADHPAGALALVVWVLALYLPGFAALPAVDRDESRFAQASRQMLESGDLVVPRVLDAPRLNKPPLIYWLQSGAAWLCTGGDPTRDAAWMYRVPSLVAGLLTVLVAWRWGCAMFDARAAWLAAALLAACPVFWWEARQARADMVMVLFTTAAGWLLWEILRRERQGRPAPRSLTLGLWLAVGFGVLTKGPVTPLVVLLAVGVLGAARGSWRPVLAIGPITGLLVVALMVVPWAALVARRVGWDAYLQTVLAETLGRSAQPREGHEGPSFFHAGFALLLAWPLCIAGPVAIWRAANLATHPAGGVGWLVRARARLSTLGAGRRAEVFLLAWIVPAWVLFESTATKLPHYPMPLYPALFMLLARGALSTRWSREASRVPLARVLLAGWVGVGVLMCLVIFGIAALGRAGGASATPISPSFTLSAGMLHAGALAGVGLGLAGWLVIKTRRARRAGSPLRALGPGVLAWFLASVLGGVLLPALPWPWASRDLWRAVRDADPAGEARVASVVYHEDSLTFESRGRARRLDEYRLKFWLREQPGRALVIIPEKRAAWWPRVKTLARVPSYNYTKGRFEPLVLVEFGAPTP